jgi:diacylglycerol kinase family enzyme
MGTRGVWIEERPAIGPDDPIEIVVALGAGDGRAGRDAARLARGLRGRYRHVRVTELADGAALRRWARTAERAALLICVGGDGTQNKVADVAVRTGATLLPVPRGFGNLFATAMGLDGRVDRTIELVERGRPVRVDVGLSNGEAFLCQETLGLLAETQREAEASVAGPRRTWRRYLAYCRAAARRVVSAPMPRLQVVVDGRAVASEAPVVTVANVPAYGRWLSVTPDASPLNGMFDVFVIEDRRVGRILWELISRHLRIPGARRGGRLYRARRVTVLGPEGVVCSLEVLPRRLPVLVPPERAAVLVTGAAPAAAASGWPDGMAAAASGASARA